MVCVDVYIRMWQLVSPLLSRVHHSEKFLLMDWQVAYCDREGFIVSLNGMEVLESVDHILLGQHARNC